MALNMTLSGCAFKRMANVGAGLIRTLELKKTSPLIAIQLAASRNCGTLARPRNGSWLTCGEDYASGAFVGPAP
jgi:hypothetical protein